MQDPPDLPATDIGRPHRHRNVPTCDPSAPADIEALLADLPRRRDLLIEYLHRIQDRFGCLSSRHLQALAELTGLPQAEVIEIARFTRHFDIVAEGTEAPPPLTIRVCSSLSCSLAGADALFSHLSEWADPARVRVLRVPCLGRCAEAPAAFVGKRAVTKATPEAVVATVEGGDFAPALPAFVVGLQMYREAGGYGLLEACRAGKLPVGELIAILAEAGLRGLGGAGTPVSEKWAAVLRHPGPRLVTVNANEGEPGAFKDRHYLLRDPHRMLEGALIAAWAIEAERIVLYLSDDYPDAHAILLREIALLAEAGLSGPTPIELRRGAGRYLCGEETAMLESIEGKRGLPRRRPPDITERGLFGRPTLVHNIETLWWLRDIVERGADWFAGLGKPGHTGLRSYSVSGRVARPGIKVAPAGITLAELIEKHCGGMAPGHQLAAFLPGGASGGIFPAAFADRPLDFGTFEPDGGSIGVHAIIVLSDKDDVPAAALTLLRFLRDESCGQCPACRTGTETLVALFGAGNADADAITALAKAIDEGSLCGLGPAAAKLACGLLRNFPQNPTSEGT